MLQVVLASRESTLRTLNVLENYQETPYNRLSSLSSEASSGLAVMHMSPRQNSLISFGGCPTPSGKRRADIMLRCNYPSIEPNKKPWALKKISEEELVHNEPLES